MTDLPEGAELLSMSEAWGRGWQAEYSTGWFDVADLPPSTPLDLIVVARPKPEPTWQERLLAEYPDAECPERLTDDSGGYTHLSLSRDEDGERLCWWWWWSVNPWDVPDTIRVWRLPDGVEVLRPEPTVTIPLSVAKRGLYSIRDDPNRAPGDEAIVRAAIAEASSSR